MITKICENCGKEFSVIKSREFTAKYCCRKCSDESKKGELNTRCSICGKSFHMKQTQQIRYKRVLGYFCSRNCLNKAKETAYKGMGNHQFGLKGNLNSSFKGKEIVVTNHSNKDILVYVPNHPYANKAGRVKKHRLIVEQNYKLFNLNYFIIMNGNYYLKPKIDVHHIDGNHNNNEITNLIPCSRSEHKKYHKSSIVERDNKGKIIKTITAVNKQGELLGNLEVDNQQPSQPLTKLEGSETNS